MLLRTISAAMLALALCAGARADDGCSTCDEKKPKCAECESCSTCEKVKRCGGPVKNFFVHKVGGTIGHGFGYGGCSSCDAPPPEPKSDCGCGK